MENVGIVVEDLPAAINFFARLGLELEGEVTVDQDWAARISGFDEVRLDVAMMRTPDGNGRVELMSYDTPTAIRTEPVNAPANALGLRRVLFAVEDIEDVVAGLRARGVELVGELTPVEDSYLFCYVRGPEGIIVALAEKLG
ncbi:VOC family protein [Promicromonospora iranensis]|uniref:VOC family protein n=1 Tax=Promicromonospora iranensis TaxID=1105144 RepID=UPI0023AA0BFB|nr:VOC family protein [Promicromonospora iranensis]